jgi:hypothetical protein
MLDLSPEAREMRSTSTHASGWTLLTSRDFGLLFAGQTISQIGDSLNRWLCCGSCTI